MNVPPDLADKVLQADARNIVKNVGDGTPLTGPQRELMQAFAMTLDMANAARAYAFIQRYCAGHDLTPQQWAEVHLVYPDFRPGVPAPPAPVGAEAVAAFALTAEPRRAELSNTQREAWSRTYLTGGRQIRRWWDEGAPLHDPAAMPGWWEAERASGRKKWGVPDKLLAAAKAHAATAPAPSPETPLPDLSVPAGNAAPGEAGPRPGDPNKSIDLADYDAAEGDMLRDLKTLHAARKAELTRALKAGEDANLLQNNYLKLTEQLDKMESRIVERLKKKGLFIFRPDVERDIAKAAEMMRQMTESESRRVLELCPALSIEAREQVSAAVIRVGTARARALRNLASLKSTADAVLEYVAA